MTRSRSPEADRHIVAIGGGGFGAEDFPLLEYVLGLSGVPEPKVCFIGTAYGDDKETRDWFYQGMQEFSCVPTHLGLFHRTIQDIREFLLEQDVVYVGGGSTANLLAVWRAHGLDQILHEAWKTGVVLSGVSAGANCWFEASITDSYRPELDPLYDGLGLLKGSICPHYDGEKNRRPVLHKLLRDGFPAAVAIDDGVGVHFTEGDLHEVITVRPSATAYRVHFAEGQVHEKTLPARCLR